MSLKELCCKTKNNNMNINLKTKAKIYIFSFDNCQMVALLRFTY